MDEQRLLSIRIQMEVLVTEREAMIAANNHRAMQGFSQSYGEESFWKVQNAFAHLVSALQ